jgi:WD40 repeat protein
MRWVCTTSADHTAILWPGWPYCDEKKTLSGHTDFVTSGMFSEDGALVVTSSHDNTAKIWNTSTGECTMTLVGHPDLLYGAVFSPDGRAVLTVSKWAATIWDVATGYRVHELSGHTKQMESAVYSHDGSMVVTRALDKTAKIWKSSTGECTATLRGHTDLLQSAVFSHGGDVLTASDDCTAKLWTASGHLLQTFTGHTHNVFSAVSSKHGPWGEHGASVVTASADGTAKLWNAVTGECTMTLRGHDDWVISAVFSLDVVLTVSE